MSSGEVDWPIALDYSDEIKAQVEQVARPKLADVITIPGKAERSDAEDAAWEATLAELAYAEDDEESPAMAKKAFKAIQKDMMRARVVLPTPGGPSINACGKGTCSWNE